MAKDGDGTLTWLRDRNRQRVMGILRMQGAISQADIARATGLSRTTVSTLISELKEAGLVTDVETKSGHERGGRPGVQLVLRDPSQVVVGIDFGHSHVGVAVADLRHNILAERMQELDVNRQAQQALDLAAQMFSEVLRRIRVDRANVVGAGIGIPGPVDRAHGAAGSSTILPGWVG
ncbi:MAG TPA: ROK family transcriptional regulator, partial [Candidatus Dormibacteraeota bacterium]|nr:ROK family transcriptional regulator [Candidatus Dormibacteraeota bacterium]